MVMLPSMKLTTAAAAAFLLSSARLTSSTISASDISQDTPVSSLISTANDHLARRNFHDALTYFDVAIDHDPTNYLTIFKRGATYLSLGKNVQASRDFDRVLTIKPDFEGALLQRAKIRKRNADWDGARRDYNAAAAPGGKGGKRGTMTTTTEMLELDEAETAARQAIMAADRGDWESCVTQAGTAIMTANMAIELRRLRARCRFERGEVLEGVSDLGHVLQIGSPLTESIEPHLQISAMLFYSLADPDRGLAQVRKCLHSDPDSKSCSRLFRRQKRIDKRLTQVTQLMEKRQFAGAVKQLVGTSSTTTGDDDDVGLIQEIKDDVKEWREKGYIHAKAKEGLVARTVEMACEAYTEVSIPPHHHYPINRSQQTNR